MKRKSPPVVHFVKASKVKKQRKPFFILVSTLLSSRTKDETTLKAFQVFKKNIFHPRDLVNIRLGRLEKMIYPVGFYKTKARHLKKLAAILISKFGGEVPRAYEDLVSLPGVGRKTANLVLQAAFNKSAIAVDVHVHRLSHRLGWVKKSTPEQTEEKLKKLFPENLWKKLNQTLVGFGQIHCKPRGPLCFSCPVIRDCPSGHQYLLNEHMVAKKTKRLLRK